MIITTSEFDYRKYTFAVKVGTITGILLPEMMAS